MPDNIDHPARIKRLREAADTISSDGLEPIADLLAQTENPTCPRFLAISVTADGERRLRCHDPGALTQHLGLIAIADIPETTEVVIDLDSGARHQATTTATVIFSPPLPGMPPASATASHITAHDPPLRLDRDRLRNYLREEHKIAPGLDPGAPGGIAGAIVIRIGDAIDAAALTGPADIEVETYECDGNVVIAVREEKASPDSPAYARQIATYSIDPLYLSARDSSEAACFEAVEAVLARASALIPTLRLLQHAEQATASALDSRVPHRIQTPNRTPARR